MKFGKYLGKRHLDLPEYANYFINYKGLKKLIKRLAVDPGHPGASNELARELAYQRLQENKATFFFQLERELEKVQNFYQQKESDLEVRLDIFLQKKTAAAQSGTLTRNSVTYISLYEGLQRFRRDLERLEQFIELNGTGFSKVLKKWDKRSRSHLKELYLSRAVEVQPMFHREQLVALSDKVNQYLLELEALASGSDAVVLESGPRPASSSQDDLYYEFIKFASTYNPHEESLRRSMDEWLSQLVRADNATERISHMFLMAVSAKVQEAALLALHATGLVNMNAVDEIAGRNCLHLAASTRQPRTQIVDLALKEKVDPSLPDMYGRTPLHYAATHGRRDLLNKFLKAGASIDALDQDNLAALHYSIFHNFSGCTEDLVAAGARTTGDSERDYIPLNFACQYGAYDAVKILLSARPDQPMVPDAEGLYPLHIVARAGFASIVPLLVGVGANVDELDKLNGWTALMYAASEGNYMSVTTLLAANADWKILDEQNRSALFYAAWEGHTRSVKLLASKLPPGTVDISELRGVVDDGSDNSEAGGSERITATATVAVGVSTMSPAFDDMDLAEDIDLDGIPDLSLPPPIMPLQRYGHNFLDSQKTVLQITFAPTASVLSDQVTKFNEGRKYLAAGRMTISTSGTKDSIPRNLALPIQDLNRVQTFQVETLEKFGIDFDVYPTFGTRLLAKSTALPAVFTGHASSATLPLVDVLLRSVGELSFNFLVVKPYSGKSLEIAKYETYWKSTSFIEAGTTQAYVTASSLVGEYHKTTVVLTRDMVPLVMDPKIDVNGVELAVPALTYEQIKKLVSGPVRTLQQVLESDDDRQLDLVIPFPTRAELELASRMPVQWPEINVYVDEILHVVFDYARKMRHEGEKARSIMFSSPNPDICAVINWKQPNYPVLFRAVALRTDGKYTTANAEVVSETSLNELRVCVSLKEAAHFAATNNLMGIMVPSEVLALVPTAIQATRLQGLVLVATSENNINIDGADGVEKGDFLAFRRES